ncbi:putative peroxiredoxin [Novipirellula galeiformis]|uniref:Putative peroxiredoxin n=1 Tax=Novipirellula galeiformis TaxID=2528004 RepID=A0A5C6CQ98_9BACT|nr:redoxin domain-containing protein [Novipirellula galeiformis]TWU25266.1 putative peroxiredoxin [Novipirellula galeiformis]
MLEKLGSAELVDQRRLTTARRLGNEVKPVLIPREQRANLTMISHSIWTFAACVAIALSMTADVTGQTSEIFARIDSHDFHPLNEDGSFTSDRVLAKHGVSDLANNDWKVRLLALRDLTRSLPQQLDAVILGLEHDDPHVRQIAAAALGIARQKAATKALQNVLNSDPLALVRSQAAMSLGQLESSESLEFLRQAFEQDQSRDVRHQCELAIDQIEKQLGATESQLSAFRALDESAFEQVQVGQPAPDFTLSDTDGTPWQLKHAGDGKWVVLIWIFADWCPVCHGEFNDLLSMKEEFEDANAVVATIECHDRYRCRLMVGKEKEADYWFSKSSFQDKYQRSIWWPHLSDLAGGIGAQYGVDPMSFAVHAEYVNRPSTIIIDPQGRVRLAYYGTFWGDRPSMHETLQMIKSEEFDFEHPRRLK